jgi:uncharacterized protein YbcV (DUF1398 family)
VVKDLNGKAGEGRFRSVVGIARTKAETPITESAPGPAKESIYVSANRAAHRFARLENNKNIARHSAPGWAVENEYWQFANELDVAGNFRHCPDVSQKATDFAAASVLT